MIKLLTLTCLVSMAFGTPHSRVVRSGAFGNSKPETLPEEVLEEHDDYKLVKYEETKWVCTKMAGDINKDPMKGWKDKFNGDPMQAVMAKKDMDTPNSQMFKKLFRYIVGVNSDSAEIDMTSPVTTLRIPVPGEPNMEEMEMCFWTGPPWQDKELPTPIDKDVYIQKRPSMEVFVRRFGGWAMSREDWMEHKVALENSLADRIDVEDSPEAGFYTVGYDNPWKPINRRNEVWMKKKTVETVETTEETDAEGMANFREESLESPEYTIINKNEKFELREYPASKWVCTKTNDINPKTDPMNGWQEEFDNNPFAAMGSEAWEEQASGKMFNKLFAYIAGLNVDRVEVQMTTPVTNLHDPSLAVKEYQEMCFWLGSEWQDSPSLPLGRGVYIQERPLTRVYVRKFSGFALSFDDFYKHYQALLDDLKEASISNYDDKLGRFYQISYDSPFVIKDRHNEVWVKENPSEVE